MNSSDHVNLGRCFEGAACSWLTDQGYEIIRRNYTVKGGEIDIIAKKDNILAFIEVKARQDFGNFNLFGRPSAAVDHDKQKHLISAAERYIKEEKPSCFFRFDVLEIYYTLYDTLYCLKFNHIPSAFRKR